MAISRYLCLILLVYVIIVLIHIMILLKILVLMKAFPRYTSSRMSEGTGNIHILLFTGLINIRLTPTKCMVLKKTFPSYTSRWIPEGTIMFTIIIHGNNYKTAVKILIQPSMANLNSPSSRVVKDSTHFRRRILRCKHFGKGESWPSLFLDVVNLDLIKFRHRWILNERTFYSFIILFIWKCILT